MPEPAPVLALDTGSPTVSVALAVRGEGGGSGPRVRERAVEIGRSSQRLLGMIDELLAEAGLRPAELAGLVALAGPGSFTGLRIGLATVLGLHQATGVRAVAVPTLEVLALAGSAGRDAGGGPARCVVAAVDVLRGEWAVREYRRSGAAGTGGDLVAAGGAERLPAGELADRLAHRAPVRAVGFGIESLAPASGRLPAVELVEPPPLAAVAARRAAAGPWHAWDAGTLTAPIYFRPPAVTLPRPRR